MTHAQINEMCKNYNYLLKGNGRFCVQKDKYCVKLYVYKDNGKACRCLYLKSYQEVLETLRFMAFCGDSK